MKKRSQMERFLKFVPPCIQRSNVLLRNTAICYNIQAYGREIFTDDAALSEH